MSCVSETNYVDQYCPTAPDMKPSEQDIKTISDSLARDLASYRCNCKKVKTVCDAIKEKSKK